MFVRSSSTVSHTGPTKTQCGPLARNSRRRLRRSILVCLSGCTRWREARTSCESLLRYTEDRSGRIVKGGTRGSRTEAVAVHFMWQFLYSTDDLASRPSSQDGRFSPSIWWATRRFYSLYQPLKAVDSLSPSRRQIVSSSYCVMTGAAPKLHRFVLAQAVHLSSNAFLSQSDHLGIKTELQRKFSWHRRRDVR